MARISKRTSLFLQGLNGTVGPGCWQSPGENEPVLPRETADLGVSFCPKQSSLEDLQRAGLHLTCTFRGPYDRPLSQLPSPSQGAQTGGVKGAEPALR